MAWGLKLGGGKWAPFSSFPKDRLGETLKLLHYQSSWLGFLPAEMPGSPSTATQTCFLTIGRSLGSEITGAAPGRERVFLTLKKRDFPSLKKKLAQNFPTWATFSSLAKASSILGNIFWAEWILPKNLPMTTVKKRQVLSRENSLISSFREDSEGQRLQTICLFYK